MIDKDQVKPLNNEKYVKVYELVNDGAHRYVCASRRPLDDLMCVKSDQESGKALPDAVSCFVVLKVKGESPKLLLSWEYRYPAGQYLLSVPAGLIDDGDKANPDALVVTAVREMKEETGIDIVATDQVKVISPFVWSTPGFTDESNALVAITLNRDEMPELSQAGAEGMEMFDGFKLVDKAEARHLLEAGRDEHGIYLPLFTWSALMYFLAVEG